jgi:hypothetical protein
MAYTTPVQEAEERVGPIQVSSIPVTTTYDAGGTSREEVQIPKPWFVAALRFKLETSSRACQSTHHQHQQLIHM